MAAELLKRVEAMVACPHGYFLPHTDENNRSCHVSTVALLLKTDGEQIWWESDRATITTNIQGAFIPYTDHADGGPDDG